MNNLIKIVVKIVRKTSHNQQTKLIIHNCEMIIRFSPLDMHLYLMNKLVKIKVKSKTNGDENLHSFAWI